MLNSYNSLVNAFVPWPALRCLYFGLYVMIPWIMTWKWMRMEYLLNVFMKWKGCHTLLWQPPMFIFLCQSGGITPGQNNPPTAAALSLLMRGPGLDLALEDIWHHHSCHQVTHRHKLHVTPGHEYYVLLLSEPSLAVSWPFLITHKSRLAPGYRHDTPHVQANLYWSMFLGRLALF